LLKIKTALKCISAAVEGIQKNWTADQLIFLDESAANERTGDRKYGWSPIRTTYAVARPLKRLER
jgi:hypothetical protein